MTEAPLPAVRLAPELDRYARLGRWLAAAESGSAAIEAVEMAAALRLAFADLLGLPIYAASEVTLIRGQVGLTAKLLRALAANQGYTIGQAHLDETSCTATVERGGVELGRYTFTIDDAKRAGLVKDGGAWVTHPKRMLWARASKFAIDDFAPSVSVGILTQEEGEEIAAAAGPSDRPTPAAGAMPAADALPDSQRVGNYVDPPSSDPHLTASSTPEDAWNAVGLDAALEAARARHFVEVGRLDADASAVPPTRDDTWNDTSKRLALELYGVDSRSELLNPAQWQRLTGRMIELADADVPF